MKKSRRILLKMKQQVKMMKRECLHPSFYMTLKILQMAGAGRGRQRGGGSRPTSTVLHEEEAIVHEDPMSTDGDDDQRHVDDATEPQVHPVQYTEDGRMILDPTGLWFRDDCVIRGVTKSTKTNFVGPVPTAWTLASEEQKMRGSIPFGNHLLGGSHWNRASVKGDKYQGLLKHRETESFQKKSKQASLNKKGGKKDVVVEPTHYGGSRSFWDIVLGKGKKKKSSKTVTLAPELFLDTHSRVEGKGRTWTKPKDKELYDAFEHAKAAYPDRPDNDIWFELVDGFKKGNVYGTGSSAPAFFQSTRRRSTSSIPNNTYQPGVITQLQTQLKERDARDEERDEELRKMKKNGNV